VKYLSDTGLSSIAFALTDEGTLSFQDMMSAEVNVEHPEQTDSVSIN
jgi:hypothetical protein